MKWVIDSEQTVHVSICAGAGIGSTRYFPQRRVLDAAGKPTLADVPTVELMIEHLATPDSSGGMIKHHGPPQIKPCPVCIS